MVNHFKNNFSLPFSSHKNKKNLVKQIGRWVIDTEKVYPCSIPIARISLFCFPYEEIPA